MGVWIPCSSTVYNKLAEGENEFTLMKVPVKGETSGASNSNGFSLSTPLQSFLLRISFCHSPKWGVLVVGFEGRNESFVTRATAKHMDVSFVEGTLFGVILHGNQRTPPFQELFFSYCDTTWSAMCFIQKPAGGKRAIANSY